MTTRDGEPRRRPGRKSRARAGSGGGSVGAGSEEVLLRQRVRHLVAHGELPRDPATQIIAGFGDGAVCVVCERPVQSADVAYELRFGTEADARKMVMHYACFIIWDRERGAPADEPSGDS
jgi:hypothetical protein